MRRRIRTSVAVVATSALSAALATTLALPARAMPERYVDAGTVVWCDGEGGYLEAIDTTTSPDMVLARITVGQVDAVAIAETGLLVGNQLSGRFPAQDAETGEARGDLTVDGILTWGQIETVSGWDVDPDGRRYRSEGTRTPLSGSVTLSLGDVSTTLSCSGWELDLETFVLTRQPPSDNSRGWWQDSYPLPDGAGTVGFYGERKTQLGIALDLAEPFVFAAERLQVRNGNVEGTLLLRDPETFEVVGAATVTGTLTRTGSEQIVESGKRYKYVTTLVHYDVALTITTAAGEWSGTWPATHETNRARAVIPPRSV